MLLINIYNIRWKKRYTQAEMVKATGLSVVTVQRIFSTTRHDFRLSTVEKVAKFFGCNSLDILVEVPDSE